jgi:hypothetical protein
MARAWQRFTLTASTPPFGDSGSAGKLVTIAIFRKLLPQVLKETLQFFLNLFH